MLHLPAATSPVIPAARPQAPGATSATDPDDSGGTAARAAPQAGIGSAAAASGDGSSRVRTARPCGPLPVSRWMSIAPGPTCAHPGTCDAPK